MKTIAELALMAWDNPEWIRPIAEETAGFLEAHPGKIFTTTLLIQELGVRGLANIKAAKALGAKLAALRKPGEALEHYWRHSTTRFSPFKDRTTGERLAAIDWSVDFVPKK